MEISITKARRPWDRLIMVIHTLVRRHPDTEMAPKNLNFHCLTSPTMMQHIPRIPTWLDCSSNYRSKFYCRLPHDKIFYNLIHTPAEILNIKIEKHKSRKRNIANIWNIEVEIKRPPFCRWLIQSYFSVRILLHFYQNFMKICFQWSNWK